MYDFAHPFIPHPHYIGFCQPFFCDSLLNCNNCSQKFRYPVLFHHSIIVHIVTTRRAIHVQIYLYNDIYYPTFPLLEKCSTLLNFRPVPKIQTVLFRWVLSPWHLPHLISTASIPIVTHFLSSRWLFDKHYHLLYSSKQYLPIGKAFQGIHFFSETQLFCFSSSPKFT